MWLSALCSKQNVAKLNNSFIYLIYFFLHFQNYFDDFCCLDDIFYSNIEAENGLFSLIFDIWRVVLN